MAQRLQRLYGKRARIINGDGTDTGLPANEFVRGGSFTMLHHVPTAELQDRLFAERFGCFAGGYRRQRDGVPSLRFRNTAFPRHL